METKEYLKDYLLNTVKVCKHLIKHNKKAAALFHDPESIMNFYITTLGAQIDYDFSDELFIQIIGLVKYAKQTYKDNEHAK